MQKINQNKADLNQVDENRFISGEDEGLVLKTLVLKIKTLN